MANSIRIELVGGGLMSFVFDSTENGPSQEELAKVFRVGDKVPSMYFNDGVTHWSINTKQSMTIEKVSFPEVEGDPS